MVVFPMEGAYALEQASIPLAISPLTNEDVIAMVESGLGPEVIIEKIKASTCAFDTSPAALKELKNSGVSDEVMVVIVKAPVHKPTGASATPLSAEVLAEHANHAKVCSTCPSVLVSQVDPESGAVTDNWLSKNQLNWLKDGMDKVAKGQNRPSLFFVRFRGNADYIVLWTAARGFRPYVTYVPRTTTDRGNLSGTYTSYNTQTGYGWGDVQWEH
jgi:hypothetical protein